MPLPAAVILKPRESTRRLSAAVILKPHESTAAYFQQVRAVVAERDRCARCEIEPRSRAGGTTIDQRDILSPHLTTRRVNPRLKGQHMIPPKLHMALPRSEEKRHGCDE
jgi:hypothetical protein